MFPSFDIKIDLIKQQKELFRKIFSKTENIWKIIIFDQANHDLISPLFKLKDFRQNNITLYFNIKQTRKQLHGVTAIYLIKPNPENIEQIVKDFENQLYSSVIIHLTSEPPSTFISTFAKQLSKRKPLAIQRIQKIQFSNIYFQCIDKQMCILPQNNELVNLLITLKKQPIFICSQNEQAQVQLLKLRLSSTAFNFSNFKENCSQVSAIKIPKSYTKVLIFNRQNDLFPVLSHGITYASLMEDIWRFNRFGNKLIIDKEYQIDLNDNIWLQRKNLLISQMDLQKQCNKIKSKILTINNKGEELSELNEKNKKIEWHLDVAGRMIQQAKRRRLNKFHVVQQDLHTKKKLTEQNKKQFIQLLQTNTQVSDKSRLILAYMISVQNLQQNQVQEIQKIHPEIKNNQLYNEIKSKRMKDELPQGTLNSSGRYFKKLAKGIWKNLINEEKKFLVTRYLQKLKDLSEKNLNDLGLRLQTLSEIPLNAQVDHTVVYCVGGVCFSEYGNISQYHPNVIYCGDKLVNYRQFI